MIITSYFTNNGAPQTGLSPTITIYDISDSSVIVNAQAMTEVASGFYKYDFTTFDVTKNYAIVSDGGAGQPSGERYAYATSGTSGNIKFIKDIEGGRWKIDTDNNQMVFYEDDNSTVIATFDLKDEDGDAASTNVFERARV